MAKKDTSSRQPRLFKQEIPQMPEGYYSSGPNPNLRHFVDEHATPYDPKMDDYNVPPFDQPITTTKATAIYNMHTYWSKKPHDAIRQYIQHYTQEGDVVLVHCAKGRGRSATMTAAYLMRHEGMTYEQARDLLVSKRSLTNLQGRHQKMLESWLDGAEE